MTPTNLSDTQVGARANILRTERGRTMDDLASQMRQMGHKWSRTTVYSIEHGERRQQPILPGRPGPREHQRTGTPNRRAPATVRASRVVRPYDTTAQPP